MPPTHSNKKNMPPTRVKASPSTNLTASKKVPASAKSRSVHRKPSSAMPTAVPNSSVRSNRKASHKPDTHGARSGASKQTLVVEDVTSTARNGESNGCVGSVRKVPSASKKARSSTSGVAYPGVYYDYIAPVSSYGCCCNVISAVGVIEIPYKCCCDRSSRH